MRHVKSNAIIVVKDKSIKGMGAGQPNRLISVDLALKGAKDSLKTGGVLASDAFFPFADGLELALESGISSIIQPGGSVRDSEVIDAAKREVLEESGYESNKLIFIGVHATAPSFSKEKTHVFLAKDLTLKSQNLDKTEDIQVVEMSVESINDAVKNGDIWDGQAIAGWYMVKNYLGL